MTRLARFVSIGFVLLAMVAIVPGVALAMPMGLTTLSSGEGDFSSGVYVDGETVYLSTKSGVWTVTDSSASFVQITDPVFGVSQGNTAPMRGDDGNIYVGANFLDFNFDIHARLFDVNDLSTPVTSWDVDSQINAIAPDLSGVGTLGNIDAVRLNVNGTVDSLPIIPGFAGGGANDISDSGIIVGETQKPGLVDAPAIWDSNNGDALSFINDLIGGELWSVRDRINGGLNFGGETLDETAFVQFGDSPFQLLTDENGDPLNNVSEVYVTESDFAVINIGVLGGVYGYYDGLTETLGQALPITSIFPELAGVDFTRSGRPMVAGGELFLPLDGSIHLFGAPDPTVVPEPGTLGMLLITLLLFPNWKRRQRRVV